jgi:ATP-binding cassette subfamily C (CFTR/MRP) protein 1
LVGLNTALLALWAQDPNKQVSHTSATLPLTIITLVASVAVFVLSWFEHDRSTRPSLIVTSYLFLSAFLDLPRIRTLWLVGESRTISILFSTSLALRIFMLVLESVSKRGLLYPQYKDLQEDDTRTIFHEAGFWWLNPLFAAAYNKNLGLNDLYPLEAGLRSEHWHKAFLHAWDNGTNARLILRSEMLPSDAKTMANPVAMSLCSSKSEGAWSPVHHNLTMFAVAHDGLRSSAAPPDRV